MIDITAEQIKAATAGDASAAEAVVRAMDERIAQLAWRTDADRAEDLAQEGRIALWMGIRRFEGTTPAQFFTFADSTLRGAMSDARKEDQRQGVSRAAAQRWERALAKAQGDPVEAERIAQSREAMGDGQTLSAEMARACRLSWEGADSIDAPDLWSQKAGGSGTSTITDRLTYEDERERVSEEAALARRLKIEHVRDTLDAIDALHAEILRAEFGIQEYALPLGQDWGELARAAGIPLNAAEPTEIAARESFRQSYLGGAVATPAEGTKVCRDCKVALPLSEFSVNNKRTGARRPECKSCKKARTRNTRQANPERRAEIKRNYRARRAANHTNGATALDSERGAA